MGVNKRSASARPTIMPYFQGLHLLSRVKKEISTSHPSQRSEGQISRPCYCQHDKVLSRILLKNRPEELFQEEKHYTIMLVTNNYSGSQLSFLGLEGICLEGFLMENFHVLLAFDIIIFCSPCNICNFLFD